MNEPHEEKTDSRTYAVTRAPFRPEVDLSQDTVFQELAENLSVRQVEFAKALVLTGGVQSQAVRIIQPQVSADSARNLGARLAKQEGVMDLHRYLRQLPMADEGPQEPGTFEDMIAELEKEFFRTKDVDLKLRLFKHLVSFKSREAKDDGPVPMPADFDTSGLDDYESNGEDEDPSFGATG